MFCCSSRDDGKKANNNVARNDLHGAGSMPPPNQSGKPVGVGIVFQPDSTGALHVKSLALGGPAEKCGLVNVGDVLHEIDGHHVYRKPVAQLAPLILRQEGTVVRLGLQRGKLERLVFVRSPPMPSPACPMPPHLLALLSACETGGLVCRECWRSEGADTSRDACAAPGGTATWVEYACPAGSSCTITSSSKVVASASSGSKAVTLYGTWRRVWSPLSDIELQGKAYGRQQTRSFACRGPAQQKPACADVAQSQGALR